MNRILVLGSLNIDLVQRVPRLPSPGETLRGSDLQIFVGGKGANQACAAARLGGDVRMAGKVGSDVFADRVLGELQSSSVDTGLIGRSSSPSGTATIFVLPSGENLIVISPAANGDISVDFALGAVDHLKPGDLLLCQLEIPIEAVQAALKMAHRKGAITILDPAPAAPISDELLSSVTILTPNQTETAILLGDSTHAPENVEQAAEAAVKLRQRGAQTVIIKLGALGCFLSGNGIAHSQPGFEVDVSDTTAAGDTFNGALAAALARGSSLTEAALFANAAAALSVTKPGALASIPTLSEVQKFLSSH
jgi:ribokinase